MTHWEINTRMKPTQSAASNTLMEPTNSSMSTKNDASNMEEFLRALRDIQNLDIDKLRAECLQSSTTISQHEGEDWMLKRNHSYQSQQRETDKVRKQLEGEQEFMKEYVRVFGDRKINALHKMMEDMNGVIENLQRETKQLKEKNGDLEENIQKALKEKADALARLSQQMENQITHNNANVTDLRDQNRASKVGEKYMELYDNQWTKAFDVLTETCGQNDERAVDILLKVLIECHNFAIMRSEKQMNDLAQRISGDSTMQIGDEIKRHLNKARKLVDVARASLLFQECERHINDTMGLERLYFREKEMKKYLIECFQLCWLMAIQDPPVVLAKEAMYAVDFDLNLYKRCTRYGERVNLVVWPPLLLHKSGPLLAKGVAQAIEKKSDENIMKQKYKAIWSDESITGRTEQHVRGTEKHDLVKMTLHKPRVETNIHDMQHWLKTQNPVTTTSYPSSSGMTSDSLQAARDQSGGTGIRYQMQPVTTTYSNVSEARQQDYQASPSKRNVVSQIHTEDPGIFMPKIKHNDERQVAVRNYAQSQANTNQFCSRGTLGYKPLKENEINEFETFVLILKYKGHRIAQMLFKDNFDRFHAFYLDRL